MRILVAAAAASLMAGTAFAGGYVAPVAEVQPVAVTPIAVSNIAGGWTGWYAGLQYGQGDSELSENGKANIEDDQDSYGVHVGYNHNFGQFVLGGELDYNKVDFDKRDDDGDMYRLRVRAGYDAGRWMPYVTLGAARMSYDHQAATPADSFKVKETGITYGIGADFKVVDNFTVGLEYTKQDWDDVDDVDNKDFETDLIQLRASYRF